MSPVSGVSAPWRRAHAALYRHRRAWLARVGVTGIDVGVRLRGGRLTDEPALRVHVARKLVRLRGRRRFPSRVDGVRVDVVESAFVARPGVIRRSRGARRRCSSPPAYHDPLLGGIGIAPWKAPKFGTLGAIVVDDDDTPYGLTCRHVLAAGNPKFVVQPPGGGRSIGRAGRQRLDAKADVALVDLDGQRETASGVDGWPIRGVLAKIDDDDLPLPVRLVGACSGETLGHVTTTHWEDDIGYPSGTIHVKEHLHLRGDGMAISDSGDSGAVVLTRDGSLAVGLLRAGEPAGRSDYAIATRIGDVLGAFSDLRLRFL